MIILGIETSCDETALSIIESRNGTDITVLADKTLSQVELHRQYGGVFPNMAKREHSRNLVPLLQAVFEEAGFGNSKSQAPNSKQIPNSKFEKLKAISYKLTAILNREPELLEQFLTFIPTVGKPPIDAIAVTHGPGLEPCLWTGINLAKALSLIWNVPIVPVNHMEGHIFSALLRRKDENIELGIMNTAERASLLHTSCFILHVPAFPALALLISGGHTELVLVKDWHHYDIVGQTRDDAVGEAFDKVARLLGLPYPGGPEISRLAEEVRSESPLIKGVSPSSEEGVVTSLHLEDSGAPFDKGELAKIELPRPMLHSPDFDFSFSGIKTAVLYLLKKVPKLTDDIRKEIALEFESAVTEVLIAKTKKAMEHFGAEALLLGGGVVANRHIRREFERLASDFSIPLYIPEPALTTDNALMIAVAGLIRHAKGSNHGEETLRAQGNLRLN